MSDIWGEALIHDERTDREMNTGHSHDLTYTLIYFTSKHFLKSDVTL